MYGVSEIPREEKVYFQEVKILMSKNTALHKHLYSIFGLLLLIAGCAKLLQEVGYEKG